MLWSATRDARMLELKDLADPAIGRIAIANPRHAPRQSAPREACGAAGVWEAVQPRLVQGENIAQTAQFVQTGNAAVGIIALSLASTRCWPRRGLHADRRRPADHFGLHTPPALTAGKLLATAFAEFIGMSPRAVLRRYGFELPCVSAGR